MSETPDSHEGDGLSIVRDAPNLSGAKKCPSCGGTVAKDAVLCVLCGYNFATGKRVGKVRKGGVNGRLIGAVAAALALGGAGGWYLLKDSPEPPPPIAATAEPAPEAEAEPAEAEADEAAMAEAEDSAPAEAAEAVEAEAETEAAEPQESPEEIARREAEAERALFERKRAEAEAEIRSRFDEKEPLWTAGDSVVLRRRNGVTTRGTFLRFGRRDGVRFAVVDRDDGERVEVVVEELDVQSRRRMDADFREAFLRQYLEKRLAGGGAE